MNVVSLAAALTDCKRDLLWTDKYAPTCLVEVLGKANNIKKLHTWLEKWKKVRRCRVPWRTALRAPGCAKASLC